VVFADGKHGHWITEIEVAKHIDLFAEENQDLLMAWIMQMSVDMALEVLSEKEEEDAVRDK